MTWWGILIIVLVVAAAAALVVYFVMRSKGMTPKALKEVADNQIEIEKKKAEIAKETLRKSEAQKKALAAKLKTINTWFVSAREQIAKDKQDEYKILAGDPDSLDRKLDALLGTDEPN